MKFLKRMELLYILKRILQKNYNKKGLYSIRYLKINHGYGVKPVYLILTDIKLSFTNAGENRLNPPWSLN